MNEWLLILSMAAITFGIRFVLLATSGRWTLPPNIERSLKYVPVAVLSAIIVQTILVRAPDGSNGINVAFFWSAIVAFIVSRISNSLMITVIAGLAFYWVCISFF
ncbi:AzlD domain-containing protein [Endozoicomonas montiporae]|uniref:Branched-chain amino acid transport protein AzlD n=1 Tax=Endozoicomonas montiporae CL-33 TaxID=570277 RepID=A0A142B8V3_9GAMM|nr:AzlD domain-containing protein [Endozoicomonas montiporae]AMO55179.1 branched-chain amino acid transport protein AzlD [Endozoicomonas montiporae CL-33]